MHGLDAGNQSLRTPERFEPQHRTGNSLHRPMVLLNDVVEVFRLAQFNINAGIVIDTANGSSVGTAFVYGDLFRQAMQIDGAL